MRLIGFIGGIVFGKSIVFCYLESEGLLVVDVDKVVRVFFVFNCFFVIIVKYFVWICY